MPLSTRRHLLAGTAAGIAFAPVSSRVALIPTPSQTTGPFYPETRPFDDEPENAQDGILNRLTQDGQRAVTVSFSPTPNEPESQ